jgi:GT2 family glycosyltransferase
MSALSVVIVSYGTSAQTQACLASLADERPRLGEAGIGLEVIVVDNGSHDDTVSAVRSRFPEVTIIEAGANLGFAKAVNVGADAGSGDWILLLNPDTRVLPGSLAALIDFARQHPEHALFGGRTLDDAGELEPSSCWGAPSLWSLTCFATGLSTLLHGNRIFDPESLGAWPRDTVRRIPIVTGCVLLTTRATWDRLHGMDETYFLYGEDADLSLRAESLGLSRVLVPAAVVVHSVGGSTVRTAGSNGRKMSMVLAGRTTLLRLRWSRPRAAVGRFLVLVGCALRASGEAALRRRGTWSDVWAARHDWGAGYPRARALLFSDAGDQVRATGEVPA